MKRITLFLLAAFFVTVSSVAQSQLSARPLSQKHLDAAAQQAGQRVKQQPSQKSLRMQQSIERHQGARMALTAHNKDMGKSLAKKHQPTALRKAPAKIIREQPAGTQVLYNRSGDAYYPFWGYVFNTSLSGAVGNVVFGANDKVYIKNLVSQAGANTWTEGTIKGNSIVVELPQVAIAYPSYGYNLEVVKLTYDASQQWYVKSTNQSLLLSYDEKTGNISYLGDDIIGLAYDDDNSWSGYADFNISFTKVTDKLVEAPANLQTELYSLTADGYQGSLLKVGFSGSDIYVQGLDPNLPDTWVKGTVSGNKATFQSGQYIGADEAAGYHQYLVSATGEEVYDDYYEEYYTEYTLSNADIVFDYDAQTKTLSNGSTFLINAGKEEVNYWAALENAQIAPFVEVAATPAAPENLDLYEGGYSYYNYGYGWGDLTFDLPTSDVDGNYILPEKLSYVAWVKVNGEERQLTFSSYDYVYLDDDETTEIPFGFSEDWDFGASGTQHNFYYYVIGPEAYGVQAIYRAAGEERRSEIAWAEVEGLGADVQPAAATPAYPDATIGANDNKIDYSFYTGDEDINTVTNNAKPETYDVAIRLNDPALAGTLIESITIPLQEVEGVSDISVFLTSQLRVENGKNAADLVVKAITPEEPGFITVTLDKPYTIPAEGVYVGYSLTVNDIDLEANETPIAITDQVNEGSFYLHTSDGFLKWLDVADLFGGSAIIQVTVAGQNVKANAVAVADGTTQYVLTGAETTLPVTVVNHGSNGIQSFDIEYCVAGQKGSQHFAANVPALFGKSTTVALTVPAIAEKGNYELSLSVTKANDAVNEDVASTATTTIIALNTLPKKRTLLEEYTGFWCGWCPRGYVGVEKLAELYPDDYVLASYHNADELEIMTSDDFPSYVSGFPAAWMDRAVSLDAYYGTGNNDFGIADDMAERNKSFGQADISVKPVISDDEQTVTVSTDVTFPYDLTDGTFAVEYILIADGLTDESWGQSNYYADGYDGYPEYMDEFTKTSDGHVYGLVFNNVVVLTSELLGGAENEIAAATADTPVKLTYTFDLDDAYNTSYEPVIQDVTKLKVAAVLINTETGEVVNANKAAVTNGTTDGIAELRDSRSAASFYDLQGRTRHSLQHGLNIVRKTDGSTRKLMVK